MKGKTTSWLVGLGLMVLGTLMGLGVGTLCGDATVAEAPTHEWTARRSRAVAEREAGRTEIEAATVSDSSAFLVAIPEFVPELCRDLDQVRAWVREDPAEALLWMATAPPGEVRDAALELICSEVVLIQPAFAVELSERYAASNYLLRESLVHQWARQDEPSAWSYAEMQPPGEFRDRLVGRVALSVAGTRPSEAARRVDQFMSSGPVRDETRVGIVALWGEQDQTAANTWIDTFDDEALRARALREIIRP
jgi:hypothetical protein